MKKLLITLVIEVIFAYAATAQVSISDNVSEADPSAALDINSTEKGLLPPRLTRFERDAIENPAAGLMIYNTSSKTMEMFDGNSWRTLTGDFKCGSSQIKDIEGNTYSTVQIGTQCWMAENLAYLPNVFPSNDLSYSSARFYVYSYSGTDISEAKSTSYYQTYGVMYNWQAAISSCPDNWHLPSDIEWMTLIDFLGGQEIAGGKLKETGTLHWNSPNTGASNLSGFTGLPGGSHYTSGWYGYVGKYGTWWSSTTSTSTLAWKHNQNYDTDYAGWGTLDKSRGFSVRCIKD